MKKLVTVIALLSLTGCATTSHLNTDPGPPPPAPIIIEKKIPVPVLCQARITKPEIDIDSAPGNVPLEDQNATLRHTIAQQATFITDLISAIVGCGGHVVQSK